MKQTFFHIILFLALLCLAGKNSWAQKEHFSGKQFFGGKEGYANYDYIYANGKSSLDGHFQFTSSDSSLIISGSYTNDKKDGVWRYIYKYEKENISETTILTDSIVETYNNAIDKIVVEKHTLDSNNSIIETLICSYSARQLRGDYHHTVYGENPIEQVGIILDGFFTGIEKKDNLTYEFQDGWHIQTLQDGVWEEIIPIEFVDSLTKEHSKNRTLKEFSFTDTLIKIIHEERLLTYISDFSGIPQNVRRIGPPARYYMLQLEIAPSSSKDSTESQTQNTNFFISPDRIEQDIQNSINQAKKDQDRREKEDEYRKSQRDIEQQVAAQQLQERKSDIEETAREIEKLHTILQEMCKERINRTISKSYNAVITQCNIVNKDTSISYLNKLNDYLQFQKSLIENYFETSKVDKVINNRIEIEQNGVGLYKDVAKSYKKLFKKTNLSPIFSNLQEYYNYIEMLDSLNVIQQLYLQVIEKRKTISELNYTILNNQEACCKKINKTYKRAFSTFNFTPQFKTAQDGNKTLEELDNFIAIQNYVIKAQQYTQTIATNEIEFKTATRKFRNIKSAYFHIADSFNTIYDFTLVENAQEYTQQLEEFILYQQQFIWILKTPTVKEINKKLRNITDKKSITNIIGL